MIGAPFLLLVTLVGPFEGEPGLTAQTVAPAKPAPTASPQPRALQKGGRRLRVIQRRGKTNDITETLRAMSLMQFGAAPAPDRGTAQNQ